MYMSMYMYMYITTVQTGPFQTQTGPPGHPWNGNGLKTGYSQKTWNGNGQTGPFQPGLRPKS